MEIRVARTLLIAVRPQFVAAREDTLHRAVDLRQLFRIFECSPASIFRVSCARVLSFGGAPASAMMIAPAAFRDPVAARVAAAARLGRSGSLPGPSRHARGGEWTSPRVDAIRGVNEDSDPPDVAGVGKGST
jgi:hypothetical protein